MPPGQLGPCRPRSERHHARCAEMVGQLERPLATCEAVIAESCYLLRGLKGAAELVLENVDRGIFQIPFSLPRAAGRVRTLLRKYSDLPADLADACLVELAAQLGTGDILTLDSHFRQLRWQRAKPFRLLINLET